MKRSFQKLISCMVLCVLCTCWTPSLTATAAFTDVPADHWAANAITWATDRNLFRLNDLGEFGLRQAMTRGEFVSALCRLFGWSLVTPETGSFVDNQSPSTWYYSAIETAYAHGAVTQQTDVFRPNDPITREELTVMLMRALGYNSIAGLTQSLPFPFLDVRTNQGYLSMAYQLGLMKGTSETTFSPYEPATREQCAVILYRLSPHLETPTMERIGITTSIDALSAPEQYSVIAVPAVRLAVTNHRVQLTYPMGEQEYQVHDNIRQIGSQAFLSVSGTEAALYDSTVHLSNQLSAAVSKRGYSGLLLDVSKVTAVRKAAMTQLVQSLKQALGALPLYVVVEAPVWQGEPVYDGYDFAALGAVADRLILRIAPYAKNTAVFPTAPPEPLEEVYYALAELRDSVPAERLSLWMTTTGNLWRDGIQGGAVRAETLDRLIAEETVQANYSARYACPYLTYMENGARCVVWYLDANALEQRMKLASFFQLEQICFSDLSTLSHALLDKE